VADVGVDFATGNGGSLEPADVTTNDDGIAESFWTLGPAEGPQTATASVTGATGSPVTFTATADNGTGAGGASVQVLGPDGGNRFSPTAVTIGVGETVTWTWPAGSQGHNVSPDGSTPSRSGNVANGPMTYSFTFTTAGVYRYHCEAHGQPGGIGMSGVVTVNSPAP
jgi:plastocyanin